MSRKARRDAKPFELGGYWLSKRPNSDSWCRTWYDQSAQQVRRVSLGTANDQEAKKRLKQWFFEQFGYAKAKREDYGNEMYGPDMSIGSPEDRAHEEEIMRPNRTMVEQLRWLANGEGGQYLAKVADHITVLEARSNRLRESNRVLRTFLRQAILRCQCSANYLEEDAITLRKFADQAEAAIAAQEKEGADA